MRWNWWKTRKSSPEWSWHLQPTSGRYWLNRARCPGPGRLSSSSADEEDDQVQIVEPFSAFSGLRTSRDRSPFQLGTFCASANLVPHPFRVFRGILMDVWDSRSGGCMPRTLRGQCIDSLTHSELLFWSYIIRNNKNIGWKTYYVIVFSNNYITSDRIFQMIKQTFNRIIEVMDGIEISRIRKHSKICNEVKFKTQWWLR